MDDKSASFNCLEGAHLYVALAREVGLKVFLGEVKRDYKDDVVCHACAALFIGTNVLLVDPSYEWFGVPHKEVTARDDIQAIGWTVLRGDLEPQLDLARCQIAEKLCPQCEIGIFNHMHVLFELGRWDEARNLVPQAMKVNHDEWPLATEQGILAAHDGKDGQALTFFTKATRLNPNDGYLHFCLAEELLKNQRVEEAKGEYEAALRLTLPPETRSNALDQILVICEHPPASPIAVTSGNAGPKTNSRTNFSSSYWDRLLKKANGGDTEAALHLGLAFMDGGLGLDRNEKEAFRWYRKAAEAGDAEAERFVGKCYEKAMGVEQDLTVAASWYRKSAEHGDVLAEMTLGGAYWQGKGVQTNEIEAEKWLVKAAESGHPFAQFTLGMFYWGHPDPAYDDRAVTWLRKAAVQGQCDAQFLLGSCYEKGRGVEKDLAEAYKWERLGSRGRPGSHISESLLKVIEPSQVVEGLKRADAFQPQRSDVRIVGMLERVPGTGNIPVTEYVNILP